MRSNTNDEFVSLDDLMGESPEFEGRRDRKEAKSAMSKRKALLAFVGASLSLGVAVSVVAAPGTLTASAAVSTGVSFYESLPTDVDFIKDSLPQHTVLLDKNGVEFANVFSENRVEVKLDAVAPVMVKAMIASEDSRFYTHHGVDAVGTVRALVSNSRGAAQQQGASTITQQLVKNMLILREVKTDGAVDEAIADAAAAAASRSYLQKLKEIRYANAVEDKYSKDEILTMYLNTVYFGKGAYGIYAASHQYFGVDPSKLTIAQSATLTAVVQSPNVYNPIDNPDISKKQRDLVLKRMVSTKAITDEEYAAALEEPTVVKTTPLKNGCGDSKYPHYCSYVMDELKSNPFYGATQEARDTKLQLGGVTITTAMDPAAMDIANNELHAAMGPNNRVASAAVTIEPGTGKIVSMAQSKSFGNGADLTEINYASSKFSVGSSFKPFTIATALEKGFDPRRTIYDSPSFYKPQHLNYPMPNGFSNYGWYNWPAMDMYKATQLSLNIYFVKLVGEVGVLNTAKMAERLGVRNLPMDEIGDRDASMTLGAHSLTPIEMADAYATFASGGLHCDPRAILSAVRTDTKAPVKVPGVNCQQVITPAVANGVTDILKGDFDEPGTAAKSRLAGGRVAAGKTGTTENYAETWFVGYTPQLSTAVWIGDPRGGQQYPLDNLTIFGRTFQSATGEDIAAPLWKNVMDGLSNGTPVVQFPAPGASPVDSIQGSSMPNVQGMDVNKAVTLLTDAGFIPEIAPEADSKDGFPAGVVVSQTPVGGSSAVPNTKVKLTLSKNSDTNIVIPERGDSK
jgi:membrane peptidoglycan carboxypeptidase